MNLKKGRILKGVGGFYYVESEGTIYECRARGNFRKNKEKPVVGDIVNIRVQENKQGYIEEILERKNLLLRPVISNVDQCLIVFSITSPEINLWLLDKFIVLAEQQNIEINICITKGDLGEEGKIENIKKIYEDIGYKIIIVSLEEKSKYIENIRYIEEIMEGKTTVLFGPSGVGKSSLLNSIEPVFKLEIGSVSEKTRRGKHTTRHSEIFKLENHNSYVIDTPGFSSLDLTFIEEYELSHYFSEISKAGEYCKFSDCKHDKESFCNVKEEVEKGNISKERYENYILFLREMKERRKF